MRQFEDVWADPGSIQQGTGSDGTSLEHRKVEVGIVVSFCFPPHLSDRFIQHESHLQCFSF